MEVIVSFKGRMKRFFFPPNDSPFWRLALPYLVLSVLFLAILAGGAYGWEYTNSPQFCGTACHTMPPEYAAYQISPHARVACVECHIGREFIGNQITRKAGDIKHIVSLAFKDYEFPIEIESMRPARVSCERCHSPEKFSDDSLRVITHYNEDEENTAYQIYLILKTGGGSKREGLGRGIHWHIENEVYYYPLDRDEQHIPYVRVVNEDGSIEEYVDIEADFDPTALDESQLKRMDCITCHNRITHRIYTPEESMSSALSHGKISAEIPEIYRKGVEVLRAGYPSKEEGLKSIASALRAYYREQYPDFYAENGEAIEQAITEIQKIYSDSVFPEQKADWDTHPNNVGHVNSPGCFRCHDGKHLNADNEAVRLECNLCHAIPIVAEAGDFTTRIEISRGPEPESHLNPNWISLHHDAFNPTCANCHTTDDPGGTSNTSFCSNSACHGNVFTYAGFNAPKLREILKDQLPPPPTPTPTPAPVVGTPTFVANIQPLFAARCVMCHNASAPPAGLDLTTYEAVMAGGQDGPVIIPGDSANSKLVQVQSAQHFANLGPDELKLVIEWIDAGAPEK
ncbi:MAG: hypothetical protein D6770_00225 [Anaerolineae bacterium]|nr:MAG: hypothetical protein D6770_00225 [Anaerolineae bacterium]